MDQDGGAFSIVLLAAVVPPPADEAPGDDDHDDGDLIDGDHSLTGEHETNFVDPFKLEATLCLCQVTGLSEISYFLRNQCHQILQAL